MIGDLFFSFEKIDKFVQNFHQNLIKKKILWTRPHAHFFSFCCQVPKFHHKKEKNTQKHKVTQSYQYSIFIIIIIYYCYCYYYFLLLWLLWIWWAIYQWAGNHSLARRPLVKSSEGRRSGVRILPMTQIEK
jgi:hypothetical protein